MRTHPISPVLKAAALSIWLLGAACGVDDAASSPSVFPPQEILEPRKIPAPPENARWLQFSAIPEAVRLLEEIQDDRRNPTARLQLAAVYQEQGFVSAGRFFERTAELWPDLSGPKGQRWAAAGSWLMTEEEAKGEYSEKERLAADLISQGRLDEALETAAEVLGRAYSLQLTAEWSHAAIRKATVEPSSVSAEALELAFRTLLTGLEEDSMPRPLSFFDRYSGYWELSNAFTALEDYPSALLSARLARDSLREELGPENIAYRTAQKELGDRIARLQHKLGV